MIKKINIALFVIIVIVAFFLIYKGTFQSLFDRLLNVDPQTRANEELSELRMDTSDTNNVNEISEKVIVLARKAAVSTTTIQIRSCETSPSTIKVKYGEEFMFENVGNATSTISLPALSYKITPGNSISIKSTDIIEPSINEAYSVLIYTCGGKQGPAGYVYVSNR